MEPPPLPPPPPGATRWETPDDHQAWQWMAEYQLRMLVAALAAGRRGGM